MQQVMNALLEIGHLVHGADFFLLSSVCFVYQDEKAEI